MPIGDDILSLCHLEACERQRLALLDLLELSNPRRPLDLEFEIPVQRRPCGNVGER